MNCNRPGCTGEIQDGYCNDCGMAPALNAPTETELLGAQPASALMTSGTRPRATGTVATRRNRLGAGLVEIPPVPVRDPESAVMTNPFVDEQRRFCTGTTERGTECREPVGRSRGEQPGRTEGFCRKCGTPFSFTAKLARGVLVAGQYDVVGCLAHGGLGWIYLARDRKVSDRWVVLKGLLNSADDDAMAAALAERRFLAEVEHPNIVKIHNFVEHGGDGYIVMEYVNGTSLRDMLKERREHHGGEPDPLPVEQAIAYIHEILPALGHLHDLGLLFCDFKPDNVMQTKGSLKLIDLGGVYRMDDQDSPVYGTAGYQAPEIAQTGPTVASDLFTVARTLAVLCTDFRGYQGTYRHTLPAQSDVPLYAEFDSVYRFLERATAANPDDRFQSAEEMAAQLHGVLREIVSAQLGAPAPGPSTRFTAEGRGSTEADWRTLPTPLVNADDPASGLIVSIGAAEPEEVIEMLRSGPEDSVEVALRLARALIEAGRLAEAATVLTGIEAIDPWEWRTLWYRGVAGLAADQPAEAARHLRAVYRQLPGELAPKLAMAYAAEAVQDHETAAAWYEIVSRTDPAFTSATFGLSRCRAALGDRGGAILAYERVPQTSSAHIDAKIAQAGLLLTPNGTVGTTPDLLRAATIIDRLPLDREQRGRLSAQVLETALHAVEADTTVESDTTTVLGHPMTERGLRLGLESTYRSLARTATTDAERIALVDRANQIRPRSLL